MGGGAGHECIACGRARRAESQPCPPDRRRAHASRGRRAPGGDRPHALLSRRARGGRVDRRALRRRASDEVVLEEEPSWGTFPPQITTLGALGVVSRAARCRRAPARGRVLCRDRRGGDRRRGAERPAPAAPGRAPAPEHRERGGPRRKPARPPHAGRPRTPRRRRRPGRFYDQSLMIGPAPPAPAADGEAETAAAAVVARPGRAARGSRDERARTPCSRASRRAARLARSRGRGRHLAQPDGARSQRQPLRSGRAGRARRDAARASTSRTCACCWSPAGPRRPSRTASGPSSPPTATSWHRARPGS